MGGILCNSCIFSHRIDPNRVHLKNVKIANYRGYGRDHRNKTCIWFIIVPIYESNNFKINILLWLLNDGLVYASILNWNIVYVYHRQWRIGFGLKTQTGYISKSRNISVQNIEQIVTPNSRDKQLQLTWAYSNRQKINTNVKNSLKEGIILYSQRSLINSPENFLALRLLRER